MTSLGGIARVNLNHLLYFWGVAREGSITAASRRLGLTHPTVSGQVHALERALGHKLLARRVRRCAPATTSSGSRTSRSSRRRLAQRLERGFPRSLDGAPVILPTDDTNLRGTLDAWFLAEDLHPQVVAEIGDAALASVFGGHGLGAFAAPTVVASALHAQYKVVPVGRVRTLRETFHAISAERRLQNPAVVAIREAARASLFARM